MSISFTPRVGSPPQLLHQGRQDPLELFWRYVPDLPSGGRVGVRLKDASGLMLRPSSFSQAPGTVWPGMAKVFVLGSSKGTWETLGNIMKVHQQTAPSTPNRHHVDMLSVFL